MLKMLSDDVDELSGSGLVSEVSSGVQPLALRDAFYRERREEGGVGGREEENNCKLHDLGRAVMISDRSSNKRARPTRDCALQQNTKTPNWCGPMSRTFRKT